MVVTKVDNLFSKNRPSAKTHLFLFTEMTLIIGIAKYCRSGNTGIASVLYLIGRSLQIATYHWITHFQQPTLEHISDERLENVREVGKLMKPTFVVLELIPLVLAICLSGSKLVNPSGVNWIPAFTCIFKTLLARTLGPSYTIESRITIKIMSLGCTTSWNGTKLSLTFSSGSYALQQRPSQGHLFHPCAVS